jgi:multidrug efflux system membrane fusion protein
MPNQVNKNKVFRPRRLMLLLLFALLASAAWQHFHGFGSGVPSGAQASRPPETSVPVTLGSVETAPFPVYLNGLGTVQAYNTVVVRTRVDGQIDKIGFKEGQLVKQGDLLAEIDPRPFQAALDQAKAKKTQDQASLHNANLDLQRYTNLGDFASRQQKDTQVATVQQFTAQIASDQAAIDNATTQLGYTTIRAPISGLAGFRQVDQGNIVNAATQTGIVTIAQIEPIAVIFTAPEAYVQDINSAQAKSALPVVAYSTDGRRKLAAGALETVNNQVDTASGTIRLKATFANADHMLWPGLSVSTRMLVRTLPDALTIPDDAVQHGPDGLYAYTVDADNKAQLQKISVGQSADGRTLVEKGLTAGQKVIVEGQYRVHPGALVSEAPKTASAATGEQ